ncbi:transient receptor potential cation channel subfamily V member 6-like [Scyliorhinus canicula]|uniref:transient receptor potential cation channel subfamily V member 6-like n=1 Tax=Scyliorhinus canicula TaxID=7830 RepID=UPI0018F39175|nr:transient receptor potential cation channel subfamily V member 6-like [Scyliorhinus canicula]
MKSLVPTIHHTWKDLKIMYSFKKMPRHGSEFFKAAHTNDTISMKALLISEEFDPYVRGNLEETILHSALFNGNKEIAELILDRIPSLINEPMTSDMYKGETPMHIAVLKQDVEMVKELLNRGADVVNARATGSCFVPGEECQCYYGEYLLSFAACIGNEEIVRTLIKHSAPLEAQDSLGNTVLHVLVSQSEKKQKYSMYDLITSLVTEKQQPSLENIVNNDGYTPLKLAAAEGDLEMFNFLVQKQKKIYWTMGTISYCVYDLTNIDTWGEQKSVLDILTTSRNREVHKLIDAKPVKELLHQKWISFAYKYFLMWMFSYSMYITIFTISSLYRPLKPVPPGQFGDYIVKTQKTLAESYQTKEDYLRLLGELITIVGALVILISEILYLYKIGPKNYFGNTSIGGPFPLLLVCYSLLIAVAVIMRIRADAGEAVPISFALIIGWCNTIYFARGFKTFGKFSIIIQKLIFGDFMHWCCLVFICIIGFTFAFYIMFQTLDLADYPYFRDFSMTLRTTFELMMGLMDIPLPYNKPTPNNIYIAYVMYMLFVYLLLLNLLIAMMDDTYWRIAPETEELWKVQIAATILLLEQRIPAFLKIRSGVPGRSLGFDDDKWYIGVEEILPETEGGAGMSTQRYSQNIRWDVVRRNLGKIINMKDSSESTIL